MPPECNRGECGVSTPAQTVTTAADTQLAELLKVQSS